MTTCTIKDSQGVAKTYPSPTLVSAYPTGAVSVFTPSDGAPIVQRSPARGNRGDLAGARFLAWDALPETAPTGFTFTGTLAALVALEGKATQLTLGTAWGALYATATNVVVSTVKVAPLGVASGVAWYSVELDFVEVV